METYQDIVRAVGTLTREERESIARLLVMSKRRVLNYWVILLMELHDRSSLVLIITPSSKLGCLQFQILY
jgi:hypothetical protein